MADWFVKYELWIDGLGAVAGLLLIGAALILDWVRVAGRTRDDFPEAWHGTGNN